MSPIGSPHHCSFLGTGVILNTLASLDTNQECNNNNFKIDSIQLVGAAVDNEEVSKRAYDTGDSTYDDREVYGGAIERQVIKTQIYSILKIIYSSLGDLHISLSGI